MLIAIVILSVLLFFAILFAFAFLVHAKYTMSMFKIEAEYAKSLEKANASLSNNQKSLIDNHIELLNRFTNLTQWTINQGLRAKEEPVDPEDRDNERMWGDPSDPNTYDDEDTVESVQEVYDLDDIDYDDIDRIAEQVVDNYQENNTAEE